MFGQSSSGGRGLEDLGRIVIISSSRQLVDLDQPTLEVDSEAVSSSNPINLFLIVYNIREGSFYILLSSPLNRRY